MPLHSPGHTLHGGFRPSRREHPKRPYHEIGENVVLQLRLARGIVSPFGDIQGRIESIFVRSGRVLRGLGPGDMGEQSVLLPRRL